METHLHFQLAKIIVVNSTLKSMTHMSLKNSYQKTRQSSINLLVKNRYLMAVTMILNSYLKTRRTRQNTASLLATIQKKILFLYTKTMKNSAISTQSLCIII